jgi:hypothetical protein
MKKITLFLLFGVSTIGFTQTAITLSQNTSMTIVTPSTVTCNMNGVPTENYFYRYFDLTALGYSQFEVNRIDFGVEEYTPGTGSYFVEVQVYSNSGGVFPAGTLTLLGSQSVEILSSYVGNIVPVTLATPIMVSTQQMIIALKINNAQTDSGGNGAGFFPGSNGLGQSAPSYISASACGISTISDIAAIGFPNVHIVLTATGNPTALSSQDFNFENSIKLYPNPVQDLLTIQSDVATIESVTILDVNGRSIMSSNSTFIDVSQLQSGVYLVNIKSGDGVLTKKFLKN